MKLVKENINEEKQPVFSFKKNRSSGKWGHLEPQNNYTIKLGGKEVGTISEIRVRHDLFKRYDLEDDGKFNVMFTINKKDPMEDNNPNCSWRWVTLKAKFDNSEAAKEFVVNNAPAILKQFDLCCIEKND
jgi:hypothetical protein